MAFQLSGFERTKDFYAGDDVVSHKVNSMQTLDYTKKYTSIDTKYLITGDRKFNRCFYKSK